MKEILFKARRASHNEWLYGSIIDSGINCRIFETGKHIITPTGFYTGIEVDPNTVCQYTGYEMFGEKVFIGDVCSNNYGTDKEVIRVVCWHEGSIVLKRIKGRGRLPKYISLHEYHKFNYKIIGDIYDFINNRRKA